MRLVVRESYESEALKEITLNQILAKIRDDKPINHFIIKCDLNPISLNFPKVNGKYNAIYKIVIANCEIHGNVNFRETIFWEQVTFNNSYFYGSIDFNNSQLKKGANFIGTQFLKPAAFNGAKFNHAATFNNARFCGPAYFSGKVQFKGSAQFDYSKFNKLAFFRAEFEGNASFAWCQFKEDANFSRSRFLGEVNFYDAIFEKYANFTESRFVEGTKETKISFAGAQFNNQASFAGSRFGGDISFSSNENDIFKYARFKEFVDFQGSNFKKLDMEYARFEDNVNFREAYFSSIVDFSYASFGKSIEFSTYKNARQFDIRSKIILRNTAFHRVHARWNDIKNHLESPESSDLNSLVKNYNELGWFDDADNCYIEYRRSIIDSHYLKYLNMLNPKYIIMKSKLFGNPGIFDFIRGAVTLLIDFISLLVYGHGVRLRWPIITAIIVLLGSAYIYYSGGQVDSFYPEGLRVSADIFFATMQLGKNTQVENLTGFCRWCSIIERLIGWILMTSFLVVLAKKTLR